MLILIQFTAILVNLKTVFFSLKIHSVQLHKSKIIKDVYYQLVIDTQGQISLSLTDNELHRTAEGTMVCVP